ncbi:hypothetical protein MAR_038185 [Mya arenaria]|uniref:Uncharacterized protein n=1 Tax=Mya arenaria TaxID=6604 RepID=A0ABY7FUW1_MYAAR|nr:hypothetical protein MAR_038185 [Mya arenaria]
MNVGSYSTFSTMSPCSMKPMFFIMDPSHTFKTIRNNKLKSGIGGINQMHRKLTNEHLYPSNQPKMRNYLAENVLDSDNLITQYRKYLGDKGQVLNREIELLEKHKN